MKYQDADILHCFSNLQMKLFESVEGGSFHEKLVVE